MSAVITAFPNAPSRSRSERSAPFEFPPDVGRPAGSRLIEHGGAGTGGARFAFANL